MISEEEYKLFLENRKYIENKAKEIFVTYQMLRDSVSKKYFKTDKIIYNLEYDEKYCYINKRSHNDSESLKFPVTWLFKPWFDLAKAEVEKEYNQIVMDKLKDNN